MLDLNLVSVPGGADAITAGYSCPCGCTPATSYHRGTAVSMEGCCCGNVFAIGPEAANHVRSPDGYQIRTDTVVAPWGEILPVAWAIGPSTHAVPAESSAESQHHETHAHASVDPVCGMTVEPEAARAKGLHSSYEGRDYFFCGKGCKLEFDDDPKRYLDPTYTPSM